MFDGDSERGRATTARSTILVGRGEVIFHQERGERQDVADVVEPIADVVGGKSSAGGIDAQQIANRVVVLGAVEASHHPRPGSRGPVASMLPNAASIDAVTRDRASSVG